MAECPADSDLSVGLVIRGCGSSNTLGDPGSPRFPRSAVRWEERLIVVGALLLAVLSATLAVVIWFRLRSRAIEVGSELETFRVRLDNEKSRLAEAERRLLRAEHDSVTQLWARGAWVERAERSLRDGAPSLPGALLLADLDSFKAINDAYGHGSGDQVLSAVAGRLRSNFGADDLIGRWGGDEFVVLLQHAPSVQELDRLQSTMKEPIRLGGVVLNVAMSVGVAQVNPGASLDALLRTADGALYEAKGRLHGGASQVRAVDRALPIDISDAPAFGQDSV